VRPDIASAIQAIRDRRTACQQQTEDLRAETDKMIAESFAAVSRSRRLIEASASILGIPDSVGWKKPLPPVNQPPPLSACLHALRIAGGRAGCGIIVPTRARSARDCR
jgi:hypothetical protein